MENVNEFFNSIVGAFSRMKFLTVAALAISAVISVGAVSIALKYARDSVDAIYVLDNGNAARATRAKDEVQKDLEAQDHLVRFHELLFNLSPSAEAIRRNIDRALVMSDRSAYDYWMDLSERGFYQRLVSANISQQMVVDSVRLDLGVYPYQAHTYGKIYLLRESNITSYLFESQCRMVDVERSENNPHGLMIERFLVTRNEKIGTKIRN